MTESPDGRLGRAASLQAWLVDRHGNNAGQQALCHRRQDAGRLIEVSHMQTLKNKLHLAAARLSPGRAVVVAMLLGPLVGALLAYGAVAAQEPTEVTIDNFTFGPPELTVAAGTTVKFVNHDDIPHNVVDKNKAFRSKPLDTDDSFSFTFANAGSYDYFCGLHPQMTGKIIVK